MKKLYIECNSGIGGDMFVGALLSLGVDEQWLLNQLSTLGIDDEYRIEIYDTHKNGILAKCFKVHCHEHGHGDEHHHAHRNIDDITSIIACSKIPEKAKEIALRIFNIIAEAEAKVHGVSVKDVHFHEVGAVDSIVDVVAAALCIDYLKPDTIIFSVLCDGSGTTKSAHGIIPVPVPATCEILSRTNLKLKIINCSTELITPTGAAIAAALSSGAISGGLVLSGAKCGCGAGEKDFDWPNIVRAFFWEDAQRDENLVLIETNIDDCSPEMLGFAMQKLFEINVKDAYFTPIYMKKNRPAVMLSVICSESDCERVAELIFRHTTSIGVRLRPIKRIVMDRSATSVSTAYGDIAAKKCVYKDIVRIYPEYESIKAAAEKAQKPLADIYNAFNAALE